MVVATVAMVVAAEEEVKEAVEMKLEVVASIGASRPHS